MENKGMQDQDVIREFPVQSHENLSSLDQAFVELEKHPKDEELLAGIFRTIHTIKGTCSFGYRHARGDHTPMDMVVRTDDGAIGLLAAYERAPENLDPAARELIRGVYKLRDRRLLVLDTERTADLAVEMTA
jgi:chemotaxis protein histidine kinase CheA